eukprot:2546051-Prymnesium_polylepis.1
MPSNHQSAEPIAARCLPHTRYRPHSEAARSHSALGRGTGLRRGARGCDGGLLAGRRLRWRHRLADQR